MGSVWESSDAAILSMEGAVGKEDYQRSSPTPTLTWYLWKMLLNHWEKLSRLPLGKLLFNKLLGRFVPYSGTIGASVEELGPWRAKLVVQDRRRIRNHLDCVHAIALMNLAELTSGLAVTCGLPKNARGIVTHLEIDYFKKARGTLTAECQYEPVKIVGNTEHVFPLEIKDTSGEIVCRAKAHWKLEAR